MPSPINILACANASFFQHLAVMLVSLFDNNPGAAFEVVVVSGDDLQDGAESLERARLERTLAGFPRVRFTLRRFRPDPALLLRTPGRYTADIYTRFWVDDFFGPEVDRVLYLDADMVVLGDIAPLWARDLGGRLLGAVYIPGSTRGRELGMPGGSDYFNSGLLLIDLRRWRAIGARQQLLAVLAQRGEEFRDPDQDALNVCFADDHQPLAYVWNVIAPFYKLSHDLLLSPAEIEAVRREARILHFNGRDKPWRYQSVHPRRAAYLAYLAKTEWRGYRPPDRTLANIARKHLGRLVPRLVRRGLRAVLG